MATTTALLSLEEYLKTVYRPDCDFVDGEIEERKVGERDHNRIQLLVASWFLNHEREWNIESIPGTAYPRLQEPSPHTRCVPRQPRYSSRTGHCDTASSLCRSPVPRRPARPHHETPRRLRRYGRPQPLGLLTPAQRIGYIYTSHNSLKLVTDRLTIPETPIYLDLPALFAELD